MATAKGAKNPPPLDEHMMELALPAGRGGWLRLMPAGPAPRREYWTALKHLHERLRFDDASGKGFAALLDLHARIQDELKPDYLLIDSRTGVTELGALATTALADCVVCLFAVNQESVVGTIAIVQALKASPRHPGRVPLRAAPVLARTTGDIARGRRTAESIDRLIQIAEAGASGAKADLKLLALPHDGTPGATDEMVVGKQEAGGVSPLQRAYTDLFQKLFPQIPGKQEKRSLARKHSPG